MNSLYNMELELQVESDSEVSRSQPRMMETPPKLGVNVIQNGWDIVIDPALRCHLAFPRSSGIEEWALCCRE